MHRMASRLGFAWLNGDALVQTCGETPAGFPPRRARLLNKKHARFFVSVIKNPLEKARLPHYTQALAAE